MIVQNGAADATPKGRLLYLNRSEGCVNVSATSGVNGEVRSGIRSAVVGDFDNDIDLDIYDDAATGSGASTLDLANVMLWSQGDGTFVADPLPAGATATLFGSRIE